MESKAKLSACRNYRYVLSRSWDNSKEKVMFICLNPSSADEIEDDKTVRKCINYAKLWNYGGIYLTNLFAYRTTDVRNLFTVDNPLGIENDKYILDIANKVNTIIVAWGNSGVYLNRSSEVLKLLENYKLYCLDINKTKEPAHPLYQKNNLLIKKYNRE